MYVNNYTGTYIIYANSLTLAPQCPAFYYTCVHTMATNGRWGKGGNEVPSSWQPMTVKTVSDGHERSTRPPHAESPSSAAPKGKGSLFKRVTSGRKGKEKKRGVSNSQPVTTSVSPSSTDQPPPDFSRKSPELPSPAAASSSFTHPEEISEPLEVELFHDDPHKVKVCCKYSNGLWLRFKSLRAHYTLCM